MKKLIYLLFPLLLSACNGSTFTSNSLVGTWEITRDYGPSNESIIFKDDGSFVKIKGNEVQDSKIIKWETDNSKTPNWIDFVYTDSTNHEEIKREKGIYEFLDDNSLRVCFYESYFDDSKKLVRPKSFSEGKTKVLKRSNKQ